MERLERRLSNWRHGHQEPRCWLAHQHRWLHRNPAPPHGPSLSDPTRQCERHKLHPTSPRRRRHERTRAHRRHIVRPRFQHQWNDVELGSRHRRRIEWSGRELRRLVARSERTRAKRPPRRTRARVGSSQAPGPTSAALPRPRQVPASMNARTFASTTGATWCRAPSARPATYAATSSRTKSRFPETSTRSARIAARTRTTARARKAPEKPSPRSARSARPVLRVRRKPTHSEASQRAGLGTAFVAFG